MDSLVVSFLYGLLSYMSEVLWLIVEIGVYL